MSTVLTSLFYFKMADWSKVEVFKSSITGSSTQLWPSLVPKAEPDCSTGKQDHRSSPRSHQHPISTATGSHKDLDRSEHERETAHKQLDREIGAQCGHEKSRGHEEHAHSKSRDLHPGCTTGGVCGPALKHGRSVDLGTSSEHPHPKERHAERGRSRECRHILTPEHLPPPSFFQSTPATPRHTSTDSLHIPSFNTSRVSLPLGRGSMGTEYLRPLPGWLPHPVHISQSPAVENPRTCNWTPPSQCPG